MPLSLTGLGSGIDKDPSGDPFTTVPMSIGPPANSTSQVPGVRRMDRLP